VVVVGVGGVVGVVGVVGGADVDLALLLVVGGAVVVGAVVAGAVVVGAVVGGGAVDGTVGGATTVDDDVEWLVRMVVIGGTGTDRLVGVVVAVLVWIVERVVVDAVVALREAVVLGDCVVTSACVDEVEASVAPTIALDEPV